MILQGYLCPLLVDLGEVDTNFPKAFFRQHSLELFSLPPKFLKLTSFVPGKLSKLIKCQVGSGLGIIRLLLCRCSLYEVIGGCMDLDNCLFNQDSFLF